MEANIKKCCVPLCDNCITRQQTLTYRTIYNTLVSAQICLCDEHDVENLLDNITPEIKLRSGGY